MEKVAKKSIKDELSKVKVGNIPPKEDWVSIDELEIHERRKMT